MHFWNASSSTSTKGGSPEITLVICHHIRASLLLVHSAVALFCQHISLCGRVHKEGSRTVPALCGKYASHRGFISSPSQESRVNKPSSLLKSCDLQCHCWGKLLIQLKEHSCFLCDSENFVIVSHYTKRWLELLQITSLLILDPGVDRQMSKQQQGWGRESRTNKGQLCFLHPGPSLLTLKTAQEAG